MSGSERILVVDDDAGIRELTCLALAGAGYAVVTAASGKEALAVAAGERFDLVLLDINMPAMDGFETLRLLKLDPARADFPVVMFSVKSEFRYRIQGMQEGAVDYITKPFSVDDLLARVRRVLTSPDAGRSVASPPAARG